MRKQMAILKTVLALRTAYNDLINRDPGVPGMMLVSGESGTGKTTAIEWLCTQTNGLMVRALSCDTGVTLLTRILLSIDQEPAPHLGLGPMVETIAKYLQKKKRSLFVDECDNLFANPRLLELLRDIHDTSHAPIILIGHAGIERRMQNKQQLFRRISQWSSFVPADIEDARVLARTLCEVDVDDDLLARVHVETRGNPGLMTVAFSKIEAFGKANRTRKVTLESWGERRLFVNPKAATRAVA